MKDKRIKSILLLLAIVLSIMPIGFATDETAVPLHQKAVFTGSAETKTIYSAGTLRVFSSGLPQEVSPPIATGETSPVEWRYNVEYYVNEILKPEWNYSGTVEAANPILTGVDNNLAKMPDYYEMPHVAFPYTLQADGETIQIHYVAIPLPNAKLVVNSAYFLNDTTAVRTPSPPISVAPMGILPQTSGGHVYSNTICGIAAAWLSFAPHRKRK
ncbi:MAG: hypothetical protein RSD54_06225 [Ruthenibacterium sp.]